MALVCRLALVAVLVLLAIPTRAGTAPRLWGDLQPGEFAVGFRTLFVRDTSRPAVADLDGRGIDPTGTLGRQIRLHIWYPARPTKRTALTLGDYAALLGDDLESAGTKRHGDPSAAFLERTVGLGGRADEVRAQLPRLLALEGRAVRDAATARGRFPLVLWPEGSSPATNSIMAEVLASHGYVVAAFAPKGTREASFSAGLADLETTVDDLQHVLGVLRADPSVDGGKVALVGLGFNASPCLALQMRDPSIDAVVSLDGGIPTPFEDGLLKRTPYFDTGAVRAPILAVYAPHPDVDPAVFDQYRYSTRTLVRFPQMTEFHFLNYGMLERFAPSVLGRSPGDTKTGFEWACRYVVAFLDATFGRRPSTPSILAPDTAPAAIAEVTIKPGFAPPPTIVELKSMIRSRGVVAVREVFTQLRASDPTPFSHQLFVDLANWLNEGHDPDWRIRRELAELRLVAYPDSARAQFSLANALERSGDPEKARGLFERSLLTLDSDPDPTLDEALRRRIADGAREGIERLKQPTS